MNGIVGCNQGTETGIWSGLEDCEIPRKEAKNNFKKTTIEGILLMKL